ncbi:hypothetical protein AB0C42_09305 [Micromonospora taraxaci]|uniref:hypothetical protein n=1 Tax=Micromonospora taraxaci TaxID=1316803 RepID=UPI0034096ADE
MHRIGVAVLSALALVATLLVAGPGVAQAAQPSGPRIPAPAGPPLALPDITPSSAQLAKLTPEERSALLDGKISIGTSGHHPSELKELRERGIITQASGCAGWNYWVFNENPVLKVDLWKYTNGIDWCYNGTQITSISPIQITGWVSTYGSTLGWRYDGVLAQAQWDYFGDKWVYVHDSQGKFGFCPIRVGCVDAQYPWLTSHTYADAGFASWGGF